MRTIQFVDWATSQGGVIESTANAYASWLSTVENRLYVDLDQADLEAVSNRIDREFDSKQRDYKSAVRKYQQFRRATGG